MKKMTLLIPVFMASSFAIAKEIIRFPAQAPAKKLQYNVECEISKANLNSKAGSWVSVAKKTTTITPSSSKNNPDINLSTDDIQIEYSALINETPFGTDVFVGHYGALNIKNLKTKDAIYGSTSSSDKINPGYIPPARMLGDVNLTYTAGYIDPSLPNSYMISCKTNAF